MTAQLQFEAKGMSNRSYLISRNSSLMTDLYYQEFIMVYKLLVLHYTNMFNEKMHSN